MITAPPALLLFEGLPGSGKTTTSQQVADHYRARGVSVEWADEVDREHPFFGPSFWKLHRLDDFDELCLERWRHLVASQPGPHWVMEGAALQCTVRFMFEQCWSVERIADYWARFEATVEPIGAAHVYLAPDDPEEFIRGHMMTVRSDVWSKISEHVTTTPVGRSLAAERVEVPVEFWVRYRTLCDELMDRSRLPVLVLDPEGDRDAMRGEVVQWITRRGA